MPALTRPGFVVRYPSLDLTAELDRFVALKIVRDGVRPTLVEAVQDAALFGTKAAARGVIPTIPHPGPRWGRPKVLEAVERTAVELAAGVR